MLTNLGKVFFGTFVLTLFFAVFTQLSIASVLSPPWCYVSAEILESNNSRLVWEVNEIIKEEAYGECPVKAGEVYKSSSGYPDILNKSDKVSMGVAGFSTMGPTGSFYSLVWSEIKDEEGNPYDILGGQISSASEQYMGMDYGNEDSGITLEENCFIGGANDAFENWLCMNGIAPLVILAGSGMVTESLIVIAIIIVAVVILVRRRKSH